MRIDPTDHIEIIESLQSDDVIDVNIFQPIFDDTSRMLSTFWVDFAKVLLYCFLVSFLIIEFKKEKTDKAIEWCSSASILRYFS